MTVVSSAWTRRDFLKHSAIASGLAISGSALVGGCTTTSNGGNTLETARRSGIIKVGIAGEQPYGFTDRNGRVTGEAPEVARAVFRALGIGDVQATQVDFASLIAGLGARQYDVVAAGMFITPKRCEEAAFSIPDYSAFTAFLVPAGNPQQIRRFEDVTAKGVRLAVLSGAVEQDYAAAAGVPAAQIQAFDSQNTMLQAVTDDRVYCAALTDISLQDLVKKNPAAGVEVTEGFNPVLNGQEQISAGGFVFRKEDNELREAFNPELQRIHENGEWLRIAQSFGFTSANLPAPGLTTERLCTAG
jgi:polar amino acid transport system substrate-binding protein